MALSDASREAISRTYLFNELGITTSSDTPSIPCDNQGALAIAENPTDYQRAKHIELRYHFIRHALERGHISIHYVPTAEQPADILTKALGPQKDQQNLELLGLRTMNGIWNRQPPGRS